MRDDFGRNIDYLRISLTDRCNFRCLYCMPEEGVESLRHQDILSFEEILKIASCASHMGVSKIRLTGGEPLVRKGIIPFIKKLVETSGIESISMTTNGFFLKDLAGDLKSAGLKRLNISLDTLDPKKFHELTRRDGLPQVLAGIEAARKARFEAIKINSVIIRGRNDGEIIPLVQFASEKGLILRFIEQMPFNRDDKENFVASSEIFKVLIDEYGSAEPVGKGAGKFKLGHGPAEMFRFGDNGPVVGFITPVTNHFCGSCNRLRITADGKLKPCLLSSREIDIRTPLRNGCSDRELEEILTSAIKSKPEKHKLAENGVESKRGMSKIGG